MPKEGFETITVDSAIYNMIKKSMKQANDKAGYRKYRSVAHFVAEAIVNYKPDTSE